MDKLTLNLIFNWKIAKGKSGMKKLPFSQYFLNKLFDNTQIMTKINTNSTLVKKDKAFLLHYQTSTKLLTFKNKKYLQFDFKDSS